MTIQELKELKEALKESKIARVEENPYCSVERENMGVVREEEIEEQQSYEE